MDNHGQYQALINGPWTTVDNIGGSLMGLWTTVDNIGGSLMGPWTTMDNIGGSLMGLWTHPWTILGGPQGVWTSKAVHESGSLQVTCKNHPWETSPSQTRTCFPRIRGKSSQITGDSWGFKIKFPLGDSPLEVDMGWGGI